MDISKNQTPALDIDMLCELCGKNMSWVHNFTWRIWENWGKSKIYAFLSVNQKEIVQNLENLAKVSKSEKIEKKNPLTHGELTANRR